MDRIEIAKKNDFREVTAFINMVFDKQFPEFMEKVYTEENFLLAEHYLIRVEGKIAACVALYPQTISFGGESIECAWIGSVSVAPERRGEGHMKRLMAHVNHVIEERGIPFAYLSGRRNRYGFYGYEITGIRNYYTFEEENIRLTVGFDNCADYEFTPLYESNSSELDSVMELYSKRAVTVRNRENMFAGMKTWYYKPYVIKKHGEFAGYMLIKDNDIAELELVSFNELLNVVGAVMLCFGSESVRIEAREWERAKCNMLAACCERYTTETLGNMRIFDYEKTLGFFLSLESRIRSLKSGRLNICVRDKKSFFIELGDGGVTIGESMAEDADICVSESELIRLMFTKGGVSMPWFDNENVRNWFPLSYTPERVDEF